VTRSGFVALAGRPNVGKSTLVNAAVGEKVAIISERPQTTRRAIRGVCRRGDCQMILVDLPGVQRARDALTERMAGRVQQELAGADLVLLMLNAEQGIGAGDSFIARALTSGGSGAGTRVVAVNKIDRVSQARVAELLQEALALGVSDEVFAISARTGEGVDALLEHLALQLPLGPFLLAEGSTSDQSQRVLLAELVREAAIRRTRDEVPHALEVEVEEIEHPRDGIARVRALIWVESASQKGILIGARGRMIKAIGSAARPELERELDAQVHLDLSVKVRRAWRRNEALLDRLGIG
jgi:GTP-binding protein Era